MWFEEKFEERKAELLSLFPGEENKFIGRDMSISGLSKQATPEPNSILGQFTRKREDDRVFYLVETKGGYVGLLRVCDAAPDSGYDRFCVAHDFSNEKENIKSIKTMFERWAERSQS